MINLKNGLNYDEYMKLGTNEDIEMNKSFYKNSPIHKTNVDVKIPSNTNIVVFSMTRCKDAATVTPILLELIKNNPNVNIKFFDKEGNENLIKKLTGEVRIPTILKLDSKGHIQNKFLEFPSCISKEIESNPTSKESIVTNFRNNKYFSETLNELSSLLINND